ncbi:biotin transporter BioY [Loigolactobacillus zhaoyuanensis]|uniref:Biotin transporter n=1 Tax=Loigolactobacillus zhaoyuanensis TaxID=2486017 RepID=A0ABW8UE89_9LACO|nr:biotin transporter BioY [Loigolactobacillus zhaoyuanensis]
MKTHDITRIAVMIAVIIVLGYIPPIPIGLIPVPLVLQNMGIILTSLLLGRKNGSFAVGLFVILAFVGFPVLSGGHGGAAVFVGPTAGYIYAWLVTPYLLGSLLRGHTHLAWEISATILVGVLFINLCGVLWLSATTQLALSKALIAGLVFLPGDLLKSGVAILLHQRLRRFDHSTVPEK